MRWFALTVLVACATEPPGPALAPRPRCTGTQLEPGMPTPVDPRIAELAWLDDSTLLVSIGGRAFERRDADGVTRQYLDIDDRSRGYAVLDVVHQRVVASYRGIEPIGVQRRRRGGVLALDIGYVENVGLTERIASVDAANGCAQVGEWTQDAWIHADPVRDAFYVAPSAGIAKGFASLERRDASDPGIAAAQRAIDPMFELAYDATTNTIIGITANGETLRTYDATTLADKRTLALGVRGSLWPTSKIDSGVLEIPYETRCTDVNPRAMRLTCREGPQRAGVLDIEIDPLRVRTRRQGATLSDVSRKDSAPIDSPARTYRADQDASGQAVTIDGGGRSWTFSVARQP